MELTAQIQRSLVLVDYRAHRGRVLRVYRVHRGRPALTVLTPRFLDQ